MSRKVTGAAISLGLVLLITVSCSRGGHAGIGGSIIYEGGRALGAGDHRAPGEVVVYDADGLEVARQRVQERDGFGFTLDPGTNRLVTTSGDAICKDTPFTLTDGQFVDLVVTCTIR